MSADEIINRLAIEEALEQLPIHERIIVEMVFHYRKPDDYEGQWPANHTEVGKYVGLRFHGKPLSEATIRNRRNTIVQRWKNQEKSTRKRRKPHSNTNKSP